MISGLGVCQDFMLTAINATEMCMKYRSRAFVQGVVEKYLKNICQMYAGFQTYI